MNRVEIENKADGIELKIMNNNSIGGRIMMIFFIVLIFCLPLIPLTFSEIPDIVTALGGMIFSVVISIFIILLMSRFICWGFWGIETVHFYSDKLTVSYDYKLFKSKPEIHKGELIALTLNQDKTDERKGIGKVEFESSEYQYQTILKVSNKEYERLTNLLTVKPEDYK